MQKTKLIILIILMISSICKTDAQWLRNPAAPPTIFPFTGTDYVGLPISPAGCKLDLSKGGAGGGVSTTAGVFDISICDYTGGTTLGGPAGYRIRLQTILHNTGTGNLFAGDLSGYKTTGIQNSFFGYGSGGGTTAPPSGSNNCFFGSFAGGRSTLSTASENNCFGSFAGVSLTTGYSNFLGSYYAGYGIVSGTENILIGEKTGYTSDFSGGTIIGHNAGYTNAADNNTFIGYKSGYNNTSGNSNLFIGANSGLTNSTGYGNVFEGASAGQLNSSGNFNCFIGADAGTNSLSDGNTYIGYTAGNTITTGSNNTFIGNGADASFTYLTNATAIGYNAICSTSNSLILGSGANVGIGTSSPSYKLDVSGDINWSTGNVLRINGNQVFSNTAYNTLVGKGISNSGGSNTVVVGNGAGASLNGYSDNNTLVGYQAGTATTSGEYNVFVGEIAGYSNTSGTDNAFFGAQAGQYNTSGAGNTCIGNYTGIHISGSSNTYNTLLGYGADVSSSSIQGAAAIGYNTSVNTSYTMRFGNTSNVGWGFGVNVSSGHAIEVGNSSSNGNGAFCTTGGAWTNGSDISIKDNIIALVGSDILSRINKLSITSWMYKGTNETHIGPMAQQFYQLFKTGKADDDKHISTIDPSGVALIGIQELSKQNESLKTQLEQQNQELLALKNKIDCISPCTPASSNEAVGSTKTLGNVITTPRLDQNIPNPFGSNSIIKYFLPEGSQKCYIIISDLNGKQIKKYNISATGNGQIEIQGREFTAGTYLYTLITNDKEIDTKKMIIIGE